MTTFKIGLCLLYQSSFHCLGPLQEILLSQKARKVQFSQSSMLSEQNKIQI